MASSTWDGSREPEVHADPLDAAMPAMSRFSSRASPQHTGSSRSRCWAAAWWGGRSADVRDVRHKAVDKPIAQRGLPGGLLVKLGRGKLSCDTHANYPGGVLHSPGACAPGRRR